MGKNGIQRVKEKVVFRPIGYIWSEHTDPQATPIQPIFAKGCQGKAEILPEYEEGLCDLDGFSHITVIYHFHKAGKVKLKVKPYLEDVEKGVFACRAPCRPNPIGYSLVCLVKREGNILFLDDLDILDGTPILDIKPFIPRYDYREDARSGWQKNIDEKEAFKRGRRGFKKG